MNNATFEDFCDCPMECDSISYSASLVSTPFDPEEMCPSKIGREDFFMKEFYVHRYPPQFVRMLEKYRNNVTSDVSDICHKNVQYRAEVIFRLATDSISVTVMKRRLSFFDKLSGFGNFLILFPPLIG